MSESESRGVNCEGIFGRPPWSQICPLHIELEPQNGECINPLGGKCVTFQRVSNFIKAKMDAAFSFSELAQSGRAKSLSSPESIFLRAFSAAGEAFLRC